MFRQHARDQYGVQRSAVIFNVQPIPNVFAFSVDGYRVAAQAFQYYHRDQFLGELVWSIIVRAICDQGWQPIRVVPRSH